MKCTVFDCSEEGIEVVPLFYHLDGSADGLIYCKRHLDMLMECWQEMNRISRYMPPFAATKFRIFQSWEQLENQLTDDAKYVITAGLKFTTGLCYSCKKKAVV